MDGKRKCRMQSFLVLVGAAIAVGWLPVVSTGLVTPNDSSSDGATALAWLDDLEALESGGFDQVRDEQPARERRARGRRTDRQEMSAPTEQPRAQQAEPDRLTAILDSIDPSLLQLSGAELEYEVVGDKLLLRGNENDLAVVELLITILDKTTERKEMRVITVTEKDANDLARTAGDALRDMLRKPNQRPEDDVSVTALSANILLVSALPGDIDFVVDTLLQVDAVKEELPPLEQLVFPIKHRKAADVAEKLDEIVKKMQEKKGAGGAKGEIQIIPNDANNSIMVLAPESERAKIQKLLNELDVEPVPGWGEVKLTFYPLMHSKANELSEVIKDLLESKSDREGAEEMIHRLSISKVLPSGEKFELPPIDLQRPTRIFPDEGTNSLIVATVEENVGPMGELIRLLDGTAVAADVGVKFFPLRFADAENVADMIKEMFEKGGELTEDPDGSGADAVPDGLIGKAIVYDVGIFSNVPTNTLIVTGREEQLLLVEMIVGELDRPATALKFPLRLIQLTHTDASRIGELITDLFEQRSQGLEEMEAGRSATERDRVFLSVDIRSNSLIVSASEQNYTEIIDIVRQLDNKPTKLFDQIRIIRLQRLAADDLQQKIEDLWQRKAELRREEDILLDLPIVVVDQRSNSLIVASSIEDFEEIQRLVETLESQPLIDDTRLFKLVYADAAVLASMLDELFQGMAGESETFRAPTIMADPRSNALVVAATRDGMERMEDLIERLDIKSGPLTAVFKVYPLKHASSAQLSTRMQELFDSRVEGDDIKRTPIVLMAEETSNSLICSASRDDHEIVVELLGLLDRPSSLARQFEIFPLKRARANGVAEKLDALFQSQADGASGRADAIATEADERTNSIIVWASPSQMANIAVVIERLDTSTPAVEMMLKVIPLRQALAQDFAELLESTLVGDDAGGDNERAIIVSWAQTQPDGTEALRKLLRQDIKIEADPRTNSLMVMAPQDSMDMLEAMIQDFDAIRPIRSEIRLFPLINSDADAMVTRLTELFESESGEGDTQQQLVFGDTIGELDIASVGQTLRFTADTRTNTLIAAGAEIDLRMVEDLVRYLDSQEVESRILEVIQTKFVTPDEIASAIQGINEQENSVLGELDDDEARLRQMDRQVSVEAVGSEEEGGRSLIVGTSRRAYNATMKMIDELDRPEPQVMISVVIAEVTLSDNFEFGMEFAGQDLHFSEEAILGPNNIIQGSDFDWVAGTLLSAAGSGLGFNFTLNGEDFSFLFHALQQDSRLEVLSRPILLIRNGDEGNITIADQVPFVQSSQINDTGSTNSVIGTEDVGIVLTATPQISPDGYVTIALKQEISNFSGENLQLTEGVSSPVFATREVDTNVTVRDGETVVIGGLITTRQSEGETKVPFLGDLPVVGALFRSTSVTESKTELMIALTVDVIRTDEERREMSLAERDRFTESKTLQYDALMEGLRILPDESLMGPAKRGPDGRTPPEPGEKSEPDLRVPKSRTYGPVISRPRPTSTVERAVYGPRIVGRADASASE